MNSTEPLSTPYAVLAGAHCAPVTAEPDAVVLGIAAPDGAEPVLAELVDAFEARNDEGRPAGRPS